MHYHISEPAANLIRGRRCGNELNNPAERPLIFYFALGSDPRSRSRSRPRPRRPPDCPLQPVGCEARQNKSKA